MNHPFTRFARTALAATALSLLPAAAEALVVETTELQVMIPADLDNPYTCYFNLEASGGTEPYYWELAAGASLPGEDPDLWDDGELGLNLRASDVGTHEFGVVVTDDNGDTATATVALTVVEDPNHAPKIESATPGNNRVRVDPYATKTFSVDATDADGDDLTFDWTVYRSVWVEDMNEWDFVASSNVLGDTTGAFTFGPLTNGEYEVHVTATDGRGADHSVTRIWSVAVQEAQPLVIGETDFEVMIPADPDPDESYSRSIQLMSSGGLSPHAWRLADGEELPGSWSEFDADGEIEFELTVADLGTNEFAVVVADAEGMETNVTITLVVIKDPNHVPVIASADPAGQWVRVDSGTNRTFSVVATDADSDELSYAWSAYGWDDGLEDYDCVAATNNTTGLFEFGPFPDGEYKVNLTVSDGQGEYHEVSWAWNVLVGAAEPLVVHYTAYEVLLPADPDPNKTYDRDISLVAIGGLPTFNWRLADGAVLPGEGSVLHPDGAIEFKLTVANLATNEFAVVVTDGEGTETNATISVVVALDPNRAPAIQSADPTAEDVRVDTGATKTFSVVATDEDGDELFYTWTVYDENGLCVAEIDDETTGSFAFGPFSDGTYEVDVVVTDGNDYHEVARFWTVVVAEPPPPAPPAPAPTTYKVAFDANGGTGTMSAQTIVRNATAKLKANAFKRSGWIFLGWAKTKTGAVAYKDQASVKNLAAAGKSATLYAKWAKKTYKVKFVANGGKGKMKVLKMTYGKGKKLTANKFKRKGYVFKGWATSKANAKRGNVKYKNKKKVKNLTATGKTVKLYAVWKKK